MSRNIVIALSGWKQSGKDTVADFVEDFLTEDFKYAVNIAHVDRASFASNIRTVIDDVFSIKENEVVDKEAPIDFVKKYFGGNKKSYRDLVILIGETMKKITNKNVWVYSLENKIRSVFKNPEYKNGDNVFIVTDVRYDNELRMLERMAKHGVDVYHFCVLRKEAIPEWVNVGLDATNPDELEIIKTDFECDASEYEWCSKNPKFTSSIINDGTMDELKSAVEETVIKRIWK